MNMEVLNHLENNPLSKETDMCYQMAYIKVHGVLFPE